MNEGAVALSKVRVYSYMIFFFDIALLFHSDLAQLFGISDRKMTYGLILLIAIQATIGFMYTVKYLTTVNQKDKNWKSILMYASRIRFEFTGMYVALGIMILNDAVIENYLLDKIAVAANIILLYYVLKDLTILQRRRY
jgi:hypothetical protein